MQCSSRSDALRWDHGHHEKSGRDGQKAVSGEAVAWVSASPFEMNEFYERTGVRAGKGPTRIRKIRYS
jgi:hypothetical protein